MYTHTYIAYIHICISTFLILVMVNLYELMRQYLKNPHVTYFYPDVPITPQVCERRFVIFRADRI